MPEVESREQLRLFIAEAGKQLQELRVWRRNAYRYPFDSVAQAFLSKAFALTRSIILLTESGMGDEAFGLSRALVECAVNLRYMTANADEIQTRAYQFAMFGYKDKGLWLYWSLRQKAGTSQEKEIRDFAARKRYTEDGRSAYKHWSGINEFVRTFSEIEHPLDAVDLNLTEKKIQRVADYYFTGCFLHCSQPGLEDYYSDARAFEVHPCKPGARKIGMRSLLIAHQYLSVVISYCLYGMNVELDQTFDCLIRHRYHEDICDFLLNPRS